MDRKSSRFLVRRLAYLRFHRASVPYGIKRLDAVPESVDICTQNIGTLSEVDIFAKASRLKCHTSIRSCLEVPFAAISQQRTRIAHSQELALVYPQKKKNTWIKRQQLQELNHVRMYIGETQNRPVSLTSNEHVSERSLNA